jgi:bifunctional non-homologous end joining protein LigD
VPAAVRRPRSQRQYLPQPVPSFLPFQHPRLVEEPPTGERWIHEIKFDGYRMQVRVVDSVPTFYTRNGHDWTERLPELAAAAAQLPDCILDVELVALNLKGQPDFSDLRASLAPGKSGRLVMFVFDILWRGQDDLRRFKLLDRKAILEGLVDTDPRGRLRRVDPLPQGGPAMLQAACRMGLEGIVSKRRDSVYRSGRHDTWVKAKCRPSQEVVIGGWVQEPQRPFKAILTGVYSGNQLVYAGSVKTGFGRATGDLLKRLEPLETKVSPFDAGGAPRKTREIRWARPELVAAVDFAEWTGSGKLRQASFKGLREDKRPDEVTREAPGRDVL